MSILFVKVYVVGTFIKTVLLALLLWHDTYDDPAVWYIAVQTISGMILIVYRDTHLDSIRPEVIDSISPIVYGMRTISIGLTLETWRRYFDGRATFAFLFIIIFIVEIAISVAAGIAVQTYNKSARIGVKKPAPKPQQDVW